MAPCSAAQEMGVPLFQALYLVTMSCYVQTEQKDSAQGQEEEVAMAAASW